MRLLNYCTLPQVVGYNFAFPADAFDSDTGHLYGDFPVLFRASGIEVSHYLDNDHQVIFWGDSAKDFVVLDVVSDKSDVLWCPVSCGVKPPYCHGELDTVVDWVTNNFEQYRRVLVCS